MLLRRSSRPTRRSLPGRVRATCEMFDIRSQRERESIGCILSLISSSRWTSRRRVGGGGNGIPGMGIDLAKLLLMHGNGLAGLVEDQKAGAGGALVDTADEDSTRRRRRRRRLRVCRHGHLARRTARRRSRPVRSRGVGGGEMGSGEGDDVTPGPLARECAQRSTGSRDGGEGGRRAVDCVASRGGDGGESSPSSRSWSAEGKQEELKLELELRRAASEPWHLTLSVSSSLSLALRVECRRRGLVHQPAPTCMSPHSATSESRRTRRALRQHAPCKRAVQTPKTHRFLAPRWLGLTIARDWAGSLEADGSFPWIAGHLEIIRNHALGSIGPPGSAGFMRRWPGFHFGVCTCTAHGSPGAFMS